MQAQGGPQASVLLEQRDRDAVQFFQVRGHWTINTLALVPELMSVFVVLVLVVPLYFLHSVVTSYNKCCVSSHILEL